MPSHRTRLFSRSRSAPLLALLAASVPGAGAAQSLGSIDFPTSGSAEAQPHFIQGVLFMHNFEYEDAATHFRMAQEADPDFALAYWGEALSYNHPIWMEQDRDAALAALQRLGPTPEARAAKAGSERERRWLHAVEVMYGTVAPAEGADKHTRDDLYREEMRRLHEQYPEDHEVAAFYALAILGTAHEGRDFATYMRAAAVVDPVFEANPDHPGAAHYLIHSYDDPVHAPLGLPMARAYSVIAPGAGHAQHMTSHIFVAMGMWGDVVSANENARDVQNARQERMGRPPVVCGHYTYWLEYGYLQQGRHADARQVLDTCYERIQGSPSRGELGYFASMRARYVLDTGDWEAAEHYTADFGGDAPVGYLTVDAVAAGIRGDLEVMQDLQGQVAARAASAESGADEAPTEAQVLARALEAGVAHFSGDHATAIRLAEEAAQMEARMPFEFGPPAIVKPTYELLGEFRMAAGQHAAAAAAFQTQLDRTPRRTASLLGLARASSEIGNAVVAAEAYHTLAEIWEGADAGIEGLGEVRSADAEDRAPESPGRREGGAAASAASMLAGG